MNIAKHLACWYMQQHENDNNGTGILASRLSGLLLLTDWFSALTQGKAVTGYTWRYSESPLFRAISDSIEGGDIERIVSRSNGIDITRFRYTGDASSIALPSLVEKVAEVLLQKTKDLPYRDFCNYLMSTYPFTKSTVYEVMDLEKDAKQFHAEQDIPLAVVAP